VIESLKEAIERTETPGAEIAPGIKNSSQRDVSQVAAPFVIDQEIACEDCGGTGSDLGSLHPWDGEVCSRCAESGREMVTRNYLAEAFRIAGNPECTVPVERAHLVAIVQYCRQVVDAAMCRPKAPAIKREPAVSKSFGHSRRAARTHKVIQFKRRRRNVDIRPQST
jgi:hypothetical protein